MFLPVLRLPRRFVYDEEAVSTLAVSEFDRSTYHVHAHDEWRHDEGCPRHKARVWIVVPDSAKCLCSPEVRGILHAHDARGLYADGTLADHANLGFERPGELEDC